MVSDMFVHTLTSRCVARVLLSKGSVAARTGLRTATATFVPSASVAQMATATELAPVELVNKLNEAYEKVRPFQRWLQDRLAACLIDLVLGDLCYASCNLTCCVSIDN